MIMSYLSKVKMFPFVMIKIHVKRLCASSVMLFMPANCFIALFGYRLNADTPRELYLLLSLLIVKTLPFGLYQVLYYVSEPKQARFSHCP